MLSQFRSAHTLKIPVFISLLVLAWLLGLGATASSARPLDPPVPYPYSEGWPEPIGNYTVDESSTNFVSQQPRTVRSQHSNPVNQFEADAPSERQSDSRIVWLVCLLNRIVLVL